jgi:hypothetical protein
MREDLIRVVADQDRKDVRRISCRISAKRCQSDLKLVQAPLALEVIGVQDGDKDARLEKGISDRLGEFGVRGNLALVDENGYAGVD